MREDWNEKTKIGITVENKSKKVVLEATTEGYKFLIEEFKKLIANTNKTCLEEFDGDTYRSLGLLLKKSYGLVIIKNDQQE